MGMKVLVAGANGNTGFRLVRLLCEKDHEVRAMIRDPAQAGRMEGAGAQAFTADLEGEVAGAADGCDAVMFAAGGGRGSGPEKKEAVDHMGAVKLIEAAGGAGARRFILLSSIRIGYPDTWPEHLRAYLIAKEKADRRLQASGLDYTIVRPGRLTDAPGTGCVEAARSLGGRSGEIARDDVAAAMAACLELKSTHRRAIDILAGETPIREALAAI
jgi:uncharacterized protein YbjT (DUF2867 family)